jgi:hypothetical protein
MTEIGRVSRAVVDAVNKVIGIENSGYIPPYLTNTTSGPPMVILQWPQFEVTIKEMTND